MESKDFKEKKESLWAKIRSKLHGFAKKHELPLLVGAIILLSISGFFFLGAIFGVDESTKDTLPAILGIAFFFGVPGLGLGAMYRLSAKDRKIKRYEFEAIEKYYEMVYGLLSATYSGSSGLKRSKIKAFVEYQLNARCDERKLNFVLTMFASRGKDLDSKVYSLYGNERAVISMYKANRKIRNLTDKVLEKNRSLTKENPYKYGYDLACDMCEYDLNELIFSAELLKDKDFAKSRLIYLGLYDSLKEEVITTEIAAKYIEHFWGREWSNEQTESVAKLVDCGPAKSLYIEKHSDDNSAKQEADKKNPYQLPSYMIFRICMPQEMDKIKADLLDLLSVVASHDGDLFEEGLTNVTTKHRADVGHIAREMVRATIQEIFVEGNKVLDCIMCDSLRARLHNNAITESIDYGRKDEKDGNVRVKDLAVAVVLRAEKFDRSQSIKAEDYTSLTNKDCTEYLNKSNYYTEKFKLEAVKSYTPTSVEELANELCEWIISDSGLFVKKTHLDDGFFVLKGDWYLPRLPKEQYCADFLCSLFVKTVTEKNNADPCATTDDLIKLIENELKLSEADIRHIKSENKIEQRISDQCFGCAHYDNCKNHGRENCSAFIPKRSSFI